MREIYRDSCHFAGGLSFNGSVLISDICIEATDMMISKKYINHDQLNEDKFVFLLVKPIGGFLALFLYLHAWRLYHPLHEYDDQDNSVIATVGTGKNMISAGVLKMAIHLI